MAERHRMQPPAFCRLQKHRGHGVRDLSNSMASAIPIRQPSLVGVQRCSVEVGVGRRKRRVSGSNSLNNGRPSQRALGGAVVGGRAMKQTLCLPGCQSEL